MWLEKIRNPVLFQGDLKKNNYFEGWYIKSVSEDRTQGISFIPGVSLFRGDEHSFLQYIYVKRNAQGQKNVRTGYVRYPIDSFLHEHNPFLVEIEGNRFSEEEAFINLIDQDFTINGSLHFGSWTPIETNLWMPNIMGYFAYLPYMECYHGVISMQHTVSGSLRIEGEDTLFQNGTGYIEKDWGTSFPKKYVWMQCNHFAQPESSFMFSYAQIPFLWTGFFGHICNLVVNGKEYRFATYTGSRLQIEDIHPEHVCLVVESRKAKLRITANRNHAGELVAPYMGEMKNIIKEGLSGTITIQLWDKESGMHYEDDGHMAGVEVVGFS